MNNKVLLPVLGLFVLFGGAALFLGGFSSTADAETGTSVTLYKSLSCGCCDGYADYLKGLGFDVEVVNVDDMNPVKAKYNIPVSMQSCHTTIVGNYFVEGHVPIEAITALQNEKPDIDGIAIPGMPAGSPGMPGVKSGDWIVYALKSGVTSTFKTL